MTAEQLQTRLALYLQAEAKILQGQEYVIGDGATARRLRRADLSEVRAEITSLSNELALAQAQAAGQRRVYRFIPGG